MCNRKTLMFYINTICAGGAERVILQLAQHFAEAGYRSILINSYVDLNEFPVPDNVERITLETRAIRNSRLKRNISWILKLRRLCIHYKPKALISFMPEPCFRSLIATIGLPVVNIVSVRNDPQKHYPGLKGFILGKCQLPFADGCVFQTEDAKAWFPQRLQKKSAVIMNDVNRRFFEQQWNGGKDIINIGRLVSQKNQKLLIDAFSLIAGKYKDVNLLIYGTGPLKEELQIRIKELNLTERVFLKGLTKEVPKILSKAGMFVLSSDYEGMPNALMEALAVGVPCIATDCPCGGPRALIKHNKNGLLVSTGNKRELANAFESFLNNKKFAREVAQYAKVDSHSFETITIFNKWRTYIEDIIL